MWLGKQLATFVPLFALFWAGCGDKDASDKPKASRPQVARPVERPAEPPPRPASLADFLPQNITHAVYVKPSTITTMTSVARLRDDLAPVTGFAQSIGFAPTDVQEAIVGRSAMDRQMLLVLRTRKKLDMGDIRKRLKAEAPAVAAGPRLPAMFPMSGTKLVVSLHDPQTLVIGNLEAVTKAAGRPKSEMVASAIDLFRGIDLLAWAVYDLDGGPLPLHDADIDGLEQFLGKGNNHRSFALAITNASDPEAMIGMAKGPPVDPGKGIKRVARFKVTRPRLPAKAKAQGSSTGQPAGGGGARPPADDDDERPRGRPGAGRPKNGPPGRGPANGPPGGISKGGSQPPGSESFVQTEETTVQEGASTKTIIRKTVRAEGNDAGVRARIPLSELYMTFEEPLVQVLIGSPQPEGPFPNSLGFVAAKLPDWLTQEDRVGTRRVTNLPTMAGFSWICELLPHLGYMDLYSRIDFTKDWGDDEKNMHVAMHAIGEFLNPANPNRRWNGYPIHGAALAHFVGMSGVEDGRNVVAATLPRTDPRAGIFGYDGIAKPDDVTDGLANTVQLIEVSSLNGPWIAAGGATIRGARDPVFDPTSGFGSFGKESEGTFVLMADGSLRFLSAKTDPAVFRALCTMHGSDSIDKANWSGPAKP